MKKILRINLKERSYEVTQPSGPYRYLGGRGLTSSIVAQEVPPGCDPLEQENKLVIAVGILAGTGLPDCGRLSIGAKSPLTDTIQYGNSSGSTAHKLARLGIIALILEGCADSLVTLFIDAHGITFNSAADLPMVGNQDCVTYLRNHHDNDIGILSIGTAGEMGMKAATISETSPDFPPCMAARGGMGAVMGSKNIKAIVINDAGGADVTIKDKELFKISANAFSQGINLNHHEDGYTYSETLLLESVTDEIGAICKIADVGIIERIYARCNDLGVDPLNVGVALAVAMEADRLPWGHGPMALSLIEEIGKGTRNGRLIGNGCRYTAAQLGITRIPHIKERPAVDSDYSLRTSGGQTHQARTLQRYVAAIDTLGMGLNAALPAFDNPELQHHLIDCAGAVLDESPGADYLTHLGGMVLNEEHKFNAAAGQRDHANQPTRFFREETPLRHGNAYDFSEKSRARLADDGNRKESKTVLF